ncbi:hypothetical protein EH221_04095 [bacterium]|nr:MAG: hypothetical protein EH221_04095 [bacterium]
MIQLKGKESFIFGIKGRISIPGRDKASVKFCMLYEGECMGLGPSKAASKYGYSRQRYHQLLREYSKHGMVALMDKKTGPKTTYRKTEEVTRQVIRYRFLDHAVSAEVIAQRLRQNGFPISIRCVEEVITEYGLQKKTPHI